MSSRRHRVPNARKVRGWRRFGRRGPVTERIQKEYFAYIGGEIPDRFNWLTPVYTGKRAEMRKAALAAR